MTVPIRAYPPLERKTGYIDFNAPQTGDQAVYGRPVDTEARPQTHNTVTSLTEDENWQLPVIDLDFPCELVPSSTPGHFHLYINKPTDKTSFLMALDAMAYAGWVEPGYVAASERRGYTVVRKPGVMK